jgi:hypothetical protein
MLILKWIIGCAFSGGILALILSLVFREDLRVIMIPQPHLLAGSVILLLIAALAGIVWIAIKIFA